MEMVKKVATSHVTLAVLVAIICVLTVFDVSFGSSRSASGRKRPPSASARTSVGSLHERLTEDLHELVTAGEIRSDATARTHAKAKRQVEEEESLIVRRSFGKDDGGAVAPQGGDSSARRNVHVHVIAVGDSLTEGVSRAKEATTKLIYTPYADTLRQQIGNMTSAGSSADEIVSCTTQVFAFRGKTARGITFEASKKMFQSDGDRENLIPAAIPADLQSVLLNRVDSIRGEKKVDRIVLVCSVLAGTNDLLRTAGSTVAPALPSVSVDDTITNLLLLHELCADYARAVVKRVLKAPSDAGDGSNDLPLVEVVMLPVTLPPAMLTRDLVVHRRLVKSLEGKRHSVVATYGYCTTPQDTSVPAMLDHRRRVNDALTSPGRFVEAMEAMAHKFRVVDGAAALMSGDRTFAALKKSQQRLTPATKRGSPVPIVTTVSKATVVFPPELLPDENVVWSDCLHPTPLGYKRMAAHLAKTILLQVV